MQRKYKQQPMKQPRLITKLLAMRFSAMGDVAMTIPVLTQLAQQHPNLRITMLTRTRFLPLFEWVPSNIQVRGIELSDYKGVLGLERLYSQLSRSDFDAVADLHDVLRTKYLHSRFRLSRARVAVIDKGRRQKRAFLAHGIDAEPLRPMFERYADVFRSLGLSLELHPKQPLFSLRGESLLPLQAVVGQKQKGERWIGIAPFAAHTTKMYPLEQMQQVAILLTKRGYRVFLFGAGESEAAILRSWQTDRIQSVCGTMGGLRNELLLISRLDLMLCMDSANMHMAAMLSTPTLSLWGATHPAAGFMAWGTTRDDIIELTDLPCRPCSVYGKRPCQLGDHRCMTEITPDRILQAIETRLNALQTL